MRNKTLSIALLSVLSAALLAQAAYADNVTTTQAPGSTGTSSASSAAPGTSTTTQTTESSASTGVISQSGPTASKQYSEQGYLVIGSGNDSASGQTRVIGPDGSDTAATGTTNSTTDTSGTTTQGTQDSSVQNVNIDQSVAKPTVSAEAAILYDATTKQVLFEKNSTKAMYPASTTKLLTALLAAEKLNMSDTLTFSQSATENLESGAITAGMKKGDTMKVEDAMYAMLLRSACEVANGLAEKVSGSQSAFAELMNQRAKELGCTGSNFANASGLNSTTHYTTAADMALITAAALDNATVRKIVQTTNYTLPATANRAALAIKTGNKMAAGGTESYAGYVGGKTGYTSKAGSCLTGEVEYNGHKLVAVVFKANTTQYKDSKALFDYGIKLIGGTGSNAGTGTNTTANAATNNTANTTTNTQTASSNAQQAAAGGKWVDAGNGQK